MPTPTDLAWLAGIIDGEGCIHLSHGGTRSPHLRIAIYNGNPGILAKTEAILRDAGVPFYAREDLRAKSNTMILIGTHGCLTLYPLVRPHLVRQVDCYDAGHAFMAPCYVGGRQRVYWTAAQRTEWETLRSRFHNLAV